MKSLLAPLRSGLLALLCLLLPLLWLFRAGFHEPNVLFSNDGPYGMLVSQAEHVGEAFTGYWVTMNWLGRHELEPLPGFTQAVFHLLGSPLLFAKWFAVIGLAFLGWSGWLLARRLGLSWWCALCVGLAVELNSNPFSYACWGLVPKPVAFGFFLLAIAAMEAGPAGWRLWARTALAGFALGFGVMEGGDVGVILSLYFAAYVVWTTLPDLARSKKSVVVGAVRLLLAAGCALWLAGQAVAVLQSLAIQGVSGMQQTKASSAERWQFITGWSLPPAETTRLVVPGLYGYRMDSPNGGNYRGRVGEDGSPPRFSGSGEYAGVPVLLIALWAAGRALARSGRQPFSNDEQRRIWFWSLAIVVSLLLSYGHYFPLFKAIFALPVLNTIRIPMKYLHGLHLSVVILFGYGLLGLQRLYFTGRILFVGSMGERWKQWWQSARGFDRTIAWVFAGLAVAAGLWVLISASGGDQFSREIAASGFKPDDAKRMAGFAIRELLLFMAVLLASIGLLFLAVVGFGRRPTPSGPVDASRWAMLVALVVALDLARAAAPWVVHPNYRHRYEANPVMQYLQSRQNEYGRLTMRLLPFSRSLLAAPNDSLWGVVQNLWLEHHLQYFRVQTLDVIQWPRAPELDTSYRDAFGITAQGQLDLKSVGRLWQLTSTRFLLGASGIAEQLNAAAVPPGTRVVERLNFSLEPKPGVTQVQAEREADAWTAVATTNGPYAVMEFTGALPRASLYNNWQVLTDNSATLARLNTTDFDPTRQVLLNADPGLAAPATNAAPGTAKIAAYAPRRVRVVTQATTPSMLLFNDRWDEHWHATVDGRPAPLLRANYIMRGVALPAGEHMVEFRYTPPVPALKFTLAAIVVCFLTLVAVLLPGAPEKPSA